MPTYELPAKFLLERTFRVLSIVVALFLAGLLAISVWEPGWLTDPLRHELAYVGVAALFFGLILAMIAAGKGGIWKWKRTFHVEVAQDRIILRRADRADTEILFTEIRSIQELTGWLVVRGGAPVRGMLIPREVGDYEGLRRELATHHEIERIETPVRRVGLLPAVLFALIQISAVYLALTSHSRAIQATSEMILFVGFAWGFFVLAKILQDKVKRAWALSFYLATWICIGWILLRGCLR
jgi:hypothetical protein